MDGQSAAWRDTRVVFTAYALTREAGAWRARVGMA